MQIFLIWNTNEIQGYTFLHFCIKTSICMLINMLYYIIFYRNLSLNVSHLNLMAAGRKHTVFNIPLVFIVCYSLPTAEFPVSI